MNEILKRIIFKVGRLLATPWRRAKQRKYADPEAAATQRREFQNDRFLPLVRQYVQRGESAIIFVKGYSMRPFLEHLRDRVKLSPWQALHVGDAVLAEIAPGHFVLHRIIDLQPNGHITLMGDGNIRGTEHCTTADVCGVVTEYIRPGGHILLASDPDLQRRIRRWRRLLPLRRYLLFFYRLTIDER